MSDLIPVQEVKEFRGEIEMFVHGAGVYSVEHDGVEAGEAVLKSIVSVEKVVTARKEEITRPLMKSLSSVRDLFKPLETGLATSKKTIKEKLLAYQIEQDEKALKIASRVEKGTMKVETAAGKLAVIEGSKTNTRTLKKLNIYDETILPREFVVPNREAITKALLEGREVPGAELKEEKIIVVK